MFELRARGTDSWLDPVAQPRLSAVLRSRLEERLKGERGLFLTLTYRRDEYDSPQDLYRAQREEQHVPLFMRRLEYALDTCFKGKWIRKMEFQEGGWVHFHIILLHPERIPHALLEKAWGHGFVWVRWLSRRKHAGYLTKYVSKDAEPPPWLLLERPRSVKIVSVSPGFWGETKVRGDYVRNTDPWTKLPIWEPIGQRIAKAREVLVVRDVNTGRYDQIRADLGTLLCELRRRGCHVVGGGPRGWVRVLGRFDQIFSANGGVNGRGSGPSGEAAGPPPLHLNTTGNPDSLPPWLVSILVHDFERGAA